MTSAGRNGTTPTKRRDDFWAPFMHPDTVYLADPADGHAHDFRAMSPVKLGTFGPTCTACLKCGWVKSWGKP